tara:strand:- start:71 stop:745 length:675 start_codon:yes stop_codon:yes gene_type:complete
VFYFDKWVWHYLAMRNLILLIAIFTLIGCSNEDEIIAYDCVPETFQRSTAIYDENPNYQGYYAFGKFKEDNVTQEQTTDVPVWVENESLILNYSKKIWNTKGIIWLNDWQRNVLEADGECYQLASLGRYDCLTISRTFFGSMEVSGTYITRVTKENVWLSDEARENYNPNYKVPDGLDYDRKDYTLDRISRKLELRHLYTTIHNNKNIDKFTYQCSEKKISGEI